jgi:L-fucose isomerase-like protein
LKEIQDQGVNALVIYLGNFGPEGPCSFLAQKFPGPVMMVAAGEESGNDLIQGRGDAYCGLLSASYNMGLRRLKPYIPHYPAGSPSSVADMIGDFIPIARTLIGLRALKIFTFGPRPQDFYACNAPIQPLFDLGVEIMENSELDLFDIYQSEKEDREIKAVAQEMAQELGTGNNYPELLSKLAQYEVSLKKFMSLHLGASQYGVFANKCWPTFEKYFTFVPCYVNSRLANQGIPVACEVDVYGALSEYMVACATDLPPTLLDINNTVPEDMIGSSESLIADYHSTDLFMGFHCGNTPSSCMLDPNLKYQLIMHRLMESDKEPDITRGTLEGRIRPGEITIYRLQSTSDTQLKAYVAEGEVLDINPKSFGGIGVFAIREMGRFYRYILLEKHFPHHTAVGFSHVGKILFDVVNLLGVEDIHFNHPSGMLYPTENPFSSETST